MYSYRAGLSALPNMLSDAGEELEIFAADFPVRSAVVAECPVAFLSDQGFAVDCPMLFDALETAAVAESPLCVLYLSAVYKATLHHHRFHHLSVTDCQRSGKIRSTAAAATNQWPWSSIITDVI